MSKLTIKQVAKQLHGCEYGEEGSGDLFDRCEEAGIVVVFGYSDDNAEFRGAIHDEVGAYDDTTILLTDKGLLKSECNEGDECPYFKKTLAGAREIRATYSPWQFKTDIPHATFDVMESDDLFGRGIVFLLKDAKAR